MNNNIKVNKIFIDEHMNKIEKIIKNNQDIVKDSYASTTKIPSKEPEIIYNMIMATKKLFETIENDITMVRNIEENYQKLDSDFKNMTTELNMSIKSKPHEPVLLNKTKIFPKIGQLTTQSLVSMLAKYNKEENNNKKNNIQVRESISNKNFFNNNNSLNVAPGNTINKITDNNSLNVAPVDTINKITDNNNANTNSQSNIYEEEKKDIVKYNNQVSKNDTTIVNSNKNYQQDQDNNIRKVEENKSEEAVENSKIFENTTSNENDINNKIQIPKFDESENNDQLELTLPSKVEKENKNVTKANNNTLKTIGIVTAASAAVGGVGYSIYNKYNDINGLDDDEDDNSKEEE